MTATASLPVEQFLATLRRQGIRLWLDAGKLRCGGPDAALDDALFATLRDRRDAIVAALEREAAAPSIPPADRNEPLPLSFAQQRLWFLEQMPQEVGVYHVPLAIRVHGYLDTSALLRALHAIVERHEILRTRFVAIDGQPVQRIGPAPLPELDEITIADGPDRDARIRAETIAAATAPFDLAVDAPLRIRVLRLDATACILCFTLHHIAADGGSLDILIGELTACYRAALLGSTATLPALPVQYADFAAWQRAWLTGAELQRQIDYWRTQLAAPMPALELPTDFPRARVQAHDGAVVQFTLAAPLVERLRALGRRHGATLFMTLLAAFDVLLYRCTGQTDVVVGTPVANRGRPELEGLIGLFVNTLVLRTRLRPEAGFHVLLAAVRQTALDAYAHQDLPFEKLIEMLQPERDLSRNPLFQVKFRLENAPASSVELPGLRLERLPHGVINAKLDLGVDLYETADGIVGGFEYDRQLFTADTMTRMAGHFETVLQAIAERPDCPLAELALLTPAQRHRQLVEWNDTQRPYDRARCFHRMFEAIVDRSPDAVALVFDDPAAARSGPRIELRYGELNRRANRLAHYLRSVGVGPEVVVGICIDRSPDMIIALLAVLKAGGAYLPLDAQYPAARLAFMLADARVPVLLTHSGIALPDAPLRVDLDRGWPDGFPDTNPDSDVGPDHLAYLIYTSGSTGLPKGVLIEHGGLVNLTEDKIRVCDVRAGDCVLQFFSFSFDASIPEIIMALATGARLLLAPASALLPGPDLAALLTRNDVTHITITPSALVGVPSGDYPALRMVLVGGEAPSAELIARWSRGRVFINAYGPTETTVNASMVPCGNGHPVAATLRPSTNKQLYVLDANLQPLPVGAIGELHIGGVGLARGYANRPELTAQQFVPNPFRRGPEDRDRSAHLYRTGDLACHLPDGRIRLLGRIDHQIKIRGFRVELGDIEHALADHPHVKAAAVVAIDDARHGKRIAAFAVAAGADAASPGEIRQFLGERLPQYMVPTTFRWLDALPLTPNGKIDGQALRDAGDAPASTAMVAPRTETEFDVAAVFAEVLGRETVGVHDDFFELGGHSLLATGLVSRLLKRFAVEITVMDLFEAPTVAALAQRIVHKQQLARLQPAAGDDTEREEIAL
ncbi:MAG: amino acid adenylation domain-containing protein [Burkholderiales bacterium]|nr:amino acid adenylation domain-containing protein [Burkholderiales bacterium]